MPTPLLHNLSDEFEDRNVFLQFTLGLISACERLDAIVDQYGAPATTGESPLDDDDPCLHATLGLIALSRRVMAYMQRLHDRTPRPVSSGDEPRGTGLSVRDLLA